MPSRCLDPNEREQPRRAPEPSLAPPTSASAILAQQRSAGNHAVARTLEASLNLAGHRIEFIRRLINARPGEIPEMDKL